jgi:hypothetical protein
VGVAVNQLNGINADGDNGAFVAGLGKRDVNYFHLATPGGKLVAGMFLSGVNIDNKTLLLNALKKWQQLPAEERKPGSVPMADPKGEAARPLTPPPNGLVLRVYMRNMKRDRKGDLDRITRADLQDRKTYKDDTWRWANGIYTEPMPDVMWLTEDEWKSLVPTDPRPGDKFSVPDPIRKRIIRFHLTDGTYGLPDWWKLADIRSEELTLTVEEAGPALRLRLQGAVLLATDADRAKAHHGYDARLEGRLVYDLKNKAFTRFDFLAVGDCWGGDWEGGRFARPGPAPLGVAFELASGDRTADRVPPKGRNFLKEVARTYFHADQP